MALRSLEEWFGNWQENDFSWEGLSKKPWLGWWVRSDGDIVTLEKADPTVDREATLQDYWYSEKDHLIECDGKKWTCIHAPFFSSDGQETKKDTERAWKLILSHLAMSQNLNYFIYHYSPDMNKNRSADTRIQLQGSILSPPNFPYNIQGEWAINANLAFFKGHHNFFKCIFKGEASFSAVFFEEEANFEEADFQGRSNFSNSTFRNGGNFWKTRFRGVSMFQSTLFTGQRTSFWVANFEEEARFLSTLFDGDAWFRYTTFQGKVYFSPDNKLENGAKFTTIADFYNSDFEKSASFHKAIFNSQVSFRGVTFQKGAQFKDCQLPTKEIDFRGAFHGMTSEGLMDFRGETFHAISMFADARVNGHLLYPRPREADAERIFKALLRNSTLEQRDRPHEHALENLEQGAIALKLALSANGNKYDENKFFRYELLAREKMNRVSFSEKIALYLFDMLSRFGQSIWLPLINLIILALASIIIYLTIGGSIYKMITSCIFDYSSVKGAAQLSFYSIFRPFFFWSIDTSIGESPGWLVSLSAAIEISPTTWILLGIFSSIQSAASIICLFLFGFCLKRRFQIK